MVATTTTMHSVTGTKSIMTCLAPYFRVSSSSSSSSLSVTTCGARVEGGWPLSSTPLRGRAVDLPVSVCWLASAPSRDCTQKGNDQNGVMHCASLYGKSDGLVACRMIISTVVICWNVHINIHMDKIKKKQKKKQKHQGNKGGKNLLSRKVIKSRFLRSILSDLWNQYD